MNRKLIFPLAILVLFPMILSGCGAAAADPAAPAATAQPAGPEPLAFTPTYTTAPTDAPTLAPTPQPVDSTEAEATPVPPTAAAPSGGKLPSWCVEASSITVDDVGKSLCVGGAVWSAAKVGADYLVRFAEAEDSFSMIGYNWGTPLGVKKGQCVFAEGKIELRGNAPAMSVTGITLKMCPSGEPTPPPPAGLPADCAYALDITPLDFGKTMCFGGVVHFAGGNSREYHIYFYKDREIGASLVIYNMKSGQRGVNSGDCIFVRNKKIERVGSALLAVITPSQIEYCAK